MKKPDPYQSFVEHPRYGRGPRITGLNPETDFLGGVFLHWHNSRFGRIPNTAIVADLSKQTPATVAVTHYYDVKRPCRDCARYFIFFAEEQKYWYEGLGFGLDSDCVRCVECRKLTQGLARMRERYEELFGEPTRTVDQALEMAECALSLMEAGMFGTRQAERVRMLLNQTADQGGNDIHKRRGSILARVRAIEALRADVARRGEELEE
jgi:hypothetical protein